ncbi:MAG TPA: endonuclease NucS [Actinomycetota bacterium]|nr:endonuclease NucS [Actinomycetota bacterium]
MRLVVADCEISYTGRLHAHLPMARRLIVVKADGTVIVHADRGAKPLNWMSPPVVLDERPEGWTVLGAKAERLDIAIDRIVSDTCIELGQEPGLTKTGSEDELQALLARVPDAIEDGCLLVRREHPTDLGPVDLLLCDSTGATVAVEVKRVGDIDGVEQLARYLERLNLDPMLAPVRGVFVAQTIKPQARTLAAARGIACVEVDFDELAGRVVPDLTLF